MGVLSIIEPPLEIFRGNLDMTEPSFVSPTIYEYSHSSRIRCPSTLWITIRVSTGAVWPVGLELTLHIGYRGLCTSSQRFPRVDAANQTYERNYKAQFWYDPATDRTCWRYFVWETGAWVEDDWGASTGIDPTRVQAAMALRNSAGSGSPSGIGMHMENLRLLRGLH